MTAGGSVSAARAHDRINQTHGVRDLLAFGGSAGGFQALLGILRRLPREFPATIGVVLHRSPVFVRNIASIIARKISLPVSEPADGEAVKSGHVYLAPRDLHMTIEDECWRLDRGPKKHLVRPAVDPFMFSAAMARGNRVVGVLLSGGGADGVAGLIAISSKGGLSIVQRPEEARVKSMPLTAIRGDDVNAVMHVDEIAAALPMLAEGRSVGAEGPAERRD